MIKKWSRQALSFFKVTDLFNSKVHVSCLEFSKKKKKKKKKRKVTEWTKLSDGPAPAWSGTVGVGVVEYRGKY